jgi:arylsulfatase A-like enzyme
MKRERTFLTAVVLIAVLVTLFFLIYKISSRRQASELSGAVLILLDTVRADHLSCYGYSRETSPNISQLAQEGVLFEQTVSFSPWTLPSVVNIFSSSRPTRHVFDKRLKQSVVESISNAGYASTAFTEGGYVSRHYGFDLGFLEYFEEEGKIQFINSEKPFNADFTGGIKKTFSMAKEWLTRHRDEKFFLFIHTYEPHAPYTRRTFTEGLEAGKAGMNFFNLARNGKLSLNKQELKYLEALYDGGILESDRHVGSFMTFLEKIGLRDRTLVVVTSDHGEELGEHYYSNIADHGHSHHDNQVMVPLIIYNPCETYPVKRVSHQVRLMDVMPTIAEILNAPIDFTTTGVSLLPLMRSEEHAGRTAYGGEIKAGPKRIFLRYLGYKYIKVVGPPSGRYSPPSPPPPIYQLYDLQVDQWEQTNLANTEPLIVNQMQKILSRILSSSERDDFTIPEVINDKLRERLKSLGYLS